VLDVGQSEVWLALQIALLPCLIGYGIIARKLHEHPQTVRGEQNKYWKWILTYIDDDYAEAMKIGSGTRSKTCILTLDVVADAQVELIEKHAVKQSVSRVDELAHIFVHATKVMQAVYCVHVCRVALTKRQMEIGFWDMGARGADAASSRR
jgi:ATP-dependent RNA helicase DDX5/DBP2